jgi:alcohol dehydrogenase
MSKTMRAARMHAVGEPMRLEEVAVPQPGPRDVLVAVHAVNIVPNLANILDNWTTWFPLNPLPTLPAIFGLDPAGVVESVGEAVEGFAPGDRVYVNPARTCGGCRACREGRQVHCASFTFAGYFGFSETSMCLLDRYQGGLAEYMIAPSQSLVRIPDELGFDAAARFGYIGTMFSALRKAGAGPGRRVLVNGISGTLGLAAAMLAGPMGITELYGTGRDRDLLADVEKLAPGRLRSHSLVDGPVDEWIMDVTAGGGVDVYIDALGPGAPHSALQEGVRSLARGGVAVNIGAVAGEVPLDLHRMMDMDQTVRGSVWFTAGEGQIMADMVAAGTLDLSVLEHKVFALEQVNDAINDISARHGGFSNYVVAPHARG